MNQLLTVEVAEFVDAVDAALADLPVDVRAELLEDLPGHLADVLADGGTPRDELGEPAEYAAELRAAAGYAPLPTESGPRVDLRAKLQAADVRIGTAIGYRRLTELLVALRPAWWVLRGYLLLQLLTGAAGREGARAIEPLVNDRATLGVPVLLGLVGLSVWAGRRFHGRWALAVSIAAGVVLFGYGVSLAESATSQDTVYVGDDSSYSDPLSGTTNVYPYGPDGKVLQNVRLFDQDGNQISIESTCPDGYQMDPSGQQLFPVVCTATEGAFDPSAPRAPITAAAPSTAATMPTVPAASTPPAGATPTPAPLTSTPTITPTIAPTR